MRFTAAATTRGAGIPRILNGSQRLSNSSLFVCLVDPYRIWRAGRFSLPKSTYVSDLSRQLQNSEHKNAFACKEPRPSGRLS